MRKIILTIAVISVFLTIFAMISAANTDNNQTSICLDSCDILKNSSQKTCDNIFLNGTLKYYSDYNFCIKNLNDQFNNKMIDIEQFYEKASLCLEDFSQPYKKIKQDKEKCDAKIIKDFKKCREDCAKDKIRVCPMTYDLVCGKDNKTYTNSCELNKLNIEKACNGKCPCTQDVSQCADSGVLNYFIRGKACNSFGCREDRCAFEYEARIKLKGNEDRNIVIDGIKYNLAVLRFSKYGDFDMITLSVKKNGSEIGRIDISEGMVSEIEELKIRATKVFFRLNDNPSINIDDLNLTDSEIIETANYAVLDISSIAEYDVVKYICDPRDEQAIKKIVQTCKHGCKDGACLREPVEGNYKYLFVRCQDGSKKNSGSYYHCRGVDELENISQNICNRKCNSTTQECGVKVFKLSARCPKPIRMCSDSDANAKDKAYIRGLTCNNKKCYQDHCKYYLDKSLNLNVGEDKNITIDKIKYNIRLLSIDNSSRQVNLSINNNSAIIIDLDDRIELGNIVINPIKIDLSRVTMLIGAISKKYIIGYACNPYDITGQLIESGEISCKYGCKDGACNKAFVN